LDKDVKAIKIYLLVVIFALGLIFGRLATAGAETMYVTVREDSYLNGRESPDRHSQVLCRFSAGDEVNVLEVQDGWAKLDYGGEAEYSFVSLDYLSSSQEGTTTMYVAANGRVRIREKPDYNGETVGYVRDGDSVTVSLVFGGWAKTQRGWINTTYLED
jgi:uncharacterized protein YgiM (DUF1202 family)